MKLPFACLCLVWILPVWANPIPVLVYRMDTRPPAEIFESGFIPVGHDTNLYRHVEGYTCYAGDRSSGFVATTQDEMFATLWGSMWLPAGSHYFVYRMRPTIHFYNAASSLNQAYRSVGRQAYRNAAQRFIEQGEWVSRGRIPATSIVDAIEYISRGPSGPPPTRVTVHTHADYVEAPSQASTEPYLWNFDEDAPSSAGTHDNLCEAACFGSLFGMSSMPRMKRDVSAGSDVFAGIRLCRDTVSERLSALISSFSGHIVDESVKGSRERNEGSNDL